MKRSVLFYVLLVATVCAGIAQNADSSIKDIKDKLESMGYDISSLQKAVDDISWFNRVGDVAFIDKVFITGPPISEKQVKILPPWESVIR